MGKYSFRDFIKAEISVHVKPDDLERFARECDKYGARYLHDETASDSLACMKRNGYERFSIDKRTTGWIEFDGWTHELPMVEFRNMEDVFPPCKPVQPAEPYDGRGRHKVGDLFEAMEGGFSYSAGDIVELEKDDKTPCPYFKRISDGKTFAISWYKLKPLKPEPPKPEQPKYKVGDLFKVIGIEPHFTDFKDGEIAEFVSDECPNDGPNAVARVRNKRTGKSWLLHFHDMTPVKPDRIEQKIIITHDNKTTYAKLYEGGKVIKEGKAVCSPDDKFDFTEGASLAMYRLRYGQQANGITLDKMLGFASEIEKISQRMFDTYHNA